MVSPTAYELAARLVEKNNRLFQRHLTSEEMSKIGGLCSKNELRRNSLCFTYREPWSPNHSCRVDMKEMEEVD